MTFKDLQDALIKEITELLSEVQSDNSDGENVVGVKGYAHRLPITQSDEDDPAQYFPYFIVRHNSGETEDDDDCWHVTMDVLLGVYEDGLKPELEDSDEEEEEGITITVGGHESILVMIQRIVDRFANDPGLDHVYRADQEIQWAVGDEDTYPYYFGAVSLTFSVPKIGRKEYDV